MDLCNDEVRKALKVSANVLILFFVLTGIGIVIGILAIVDYFTGQPLFPFSINMDPPYLIIILVVLSGMTSVLLISLRKIKRKVCMSADLPMIN